MIESVVITDTSCLILLHKIGALVFLHSLYSHTIITFEIAKEFGEGLPEWITTVQVKNKDSVKAYLKYVDAGEASAIALGQEIPNSLLVIDDYKGRKLAKELQLKFTGTIGLLITAREKRIIPSLRPFFEKIKQTDFRINPKLLDQILFDFDD